MLNEDFIKQLKQTNISVDSDKSKERATRLWKGASDADKDEVMRLADVALSTVQRAYRTGGISAKLAVALAWVLQVNPFYLTAETDDDEGVYNNDVLKNFLAAHGYDDIAQTIPKTRRKREKAVSAETDVNDESEAETEPEFVIELIECEDEAPAADSRFELSDDDILVLLRALRLKAACGTEGAVAALAKLYEILLG